MRKLYTIALLLGLLLVAIPAWAAVGDITVDGTSYPPTDVSGPVVHYETPDVNPTSAFTARNIWTGNGSDHLPCEGGIHWIDNKNLLTVSHCLDTTTTTTTSTTTTMPTTTTTLGTTTTTEPTTTTTSPTTTTTKPTTTTTLGTTTTTGPTTTTTIASSTTLATTTTTDPGTTSTTVLAATTTQPELPNTGSSLAGLALAGLALLVAGIAVIRKVA